MDFRGKNPFVPTRLARFCLAALALVVATGAKPEVTRAPASSSLSPAFADIPDVEIVYYDVQGTSPEEIRRNMNRLRPTDDQGRRFDGYTRWNVRWSWPGLPGGGCDLAQVDVRVTIRVTLPRYTPSPRTPAAVHRRWATYIAALERHEANHARHAWRGVQRVRSALRQADCAGANAAGQAVLAEIRRQDAEYDRATRHGITEGARFP